MRATRALDLPASQAPRLPALENRPPRWARIPRTIRGSLSDNPRALAPGCRLRGGSLGSAQLPLNDGRVLILDAEPLPDDGLPVDQARLTGQPEPLEDRAGASSRHAPGGACPGSRQARSKMRETARDSPCPKRRFRLKLPEMSQDDQSAPLPPPQPPPTRP